MKCPRYLAVLPLALLLCTRALADGVPTRPLITVDEFGNGIVQSDDETGALQSESMPFALNVADNIVPISPLTYTLPFNGTEGFVFLEEYTGGVIPVSIPSDLLYFDGKGKLEFFSDSGPTI